MYGSFCSYSILWNIVVNWSKIEMPLIHITSEVHDLVRKHSKYDFVETGTRLPNGDWNIPMSASTIEKLHRLPGESINDCILRLFAGKPS